MFMIIGTVIITILIMGIISLRISLMEKYTLKESLKTSGILIVILFITAAFFMIIMYMLLTALGVEVKL